MARKRKPNELLPWQRATWQVDNRVGVGDIFYIFFMDESEEYFACSSVHMVVIVLATSNVGAHFGETGNPSKSV